MIVMQLLKRDEQMMEGLHKYLGVWENATLIEQFFLQKIPIHGPILFKKFSKRGSFLQ